MRHLPGPSLCENFGACTAGAGWGMSIDNRLADEGEICDERGVREDDLALRLRSGTPEVLAELFEMFHGPVRELCRRRIADVDLADDVAQETFIRAMRSIHRFDECRGIWPWLSTIARNLSVDFARSRKRRPPPLWLDSFDFPAVEARSTEASADSDDPADTIAENERRERIRRAMRPVFDAMSPIERRAVWLHHAEEEDYESIAAHERVTVDTVRNAAFRARRRLRATLAEAAGDLWTLWPLGGAISWVRSSAQRGRSRLSLASAQSQVSLPQMLASAGVLFTAGLLATMSVIGSDGLAKDQHSALQRPTRPRIVDPDRGAFRSELTIVVSKLDETVPRGSLRVATSASTRDGAVAPEEATLLIEFNGPDGNRIFWTDSTIECGDGEDWHRLPNEGPVRASC